MAVQHKDYYQVLGVARGATQDEVRKAFRKLARTHHPDVAKDKKAAEAKFREINEAYEVLSDPEKRKKYDQFGAHWNAEPSHGNGGGHGAWSSQSGGMGGFEDFDDFLQSFVNGQNRGGAQRRPGAGRGPRAQHVDTEVHATVEDVLRGARKRVNVRMPSSATPELIEVNIPPLMVPGHKIRHKGRGLHGGDLLFRVVLLPHATLRVEGSDLLKEVPVPAWKAVLGGSVEVLTPDGNVRLKIPAGTQSGRRFRLPERGLPKAEKRRGDLFVEVRLKVPDSLSLEERALWVQLQALEEARE